MSVYRLAQAAQRDLADILETIALDGELAAWRMNERFTKTFELLAHSPGMGRDFGRRSLGLRRINEGVYAILYRSLEDGAEIARVVHGMRDLDVLFG